MKAIERMNIETRDSVRANRMRQASLKARKESMNVNAEFTAIEEDPFATLTLEQMVLVDQAVRDVLDLNT